MALVRRLPCQLHIVLGTDQETPTAAHHPRAGQGMSQRAGDFCVIAVCQECHQGPLGIHGDRTMLRIAKVTEMDLLDMTISAMVSSLENGGMSVAF